MEDKALSYIYYYYNSFLQQLDLYKPIWQENSQDLNPIETIWNF